jgi:hypothetical protein
MRDEVGCTSADMRHGDNPDAVQVLFRRPLRSGGGDRGHCPVNPVRMLRPDGAGTGSQDSLVLLARRPQRSTPAGSR